MDGAYPNLSADMQAFKLYLVCLRIISFKQPPFKHKDPYWEREPWQKFGGYNNGIISGWAWSGSSNLVLSITRDDALLALKEFHDNKRFSDSEYTFWKSLIE